MTQLSSFLFTLTYPMKYIFNPGLAPHDLPRRVASHGGPSLSCCEHSFFDCLSLISHPSSPPLSSHDLVAAAPKTGFTPTTPLHTRPPHTRLFSPSTLTHIYLVQFRPFPAYIPLYTHTHTHSTILSGSTASYLTGPLRVPHCHNSATCAVPQVCASNYITVESNSTVSPTRGQNANFVTHCY